MPQKIIIQLNGLHCSSCKTRIETVIGNLAGVKKIKVNHEAGLADLEFDSEKISEKEIFAAIEKLGYDVSEKKTAAEKKAWPKNFLLAGLLLLIFGLGYFFIQKFGLNEFMSRLSEEHLSYPLIFLIGLLAGFHCVGMCGGLVITYTANNETRNKKANSFWPHFQYNLGRIISYSLIGALLGGFGSFLGLNPDFTGAVTLIAGSFMAIMGLSLLTNFSWLEKIKLKTPAFLARFIYKTKPKGPFLIGLLNGLMPCGPLQAMQVYALASGNALKGFLSLGIYALGTAPLMFGLGSFISFVSREKIKFLMKISGAIVVILGLLMLNRGLLNFGYGFKGSAAQKSIPLAADNKQSQEYQTVEMAITYSGYKPNVIYVKKAVPVRWIIRDKGITGCTGEIILYGGLNIRKKLIAAENIIEFTPKEAGEIKFSCGMRMVWGKFIVTDNAR